LPVYIRLKANTEKEALKIRADIMLPFKIRVKIYSASITVKKVIASIFSGKRKKGNRARLFNIIKKHSKIKLLKVHSRIGTGEASSTAMLSGGVLGLTAPFKTKSNYDINICPVFEESVFEFFGQCLLKTNLFHGIIAILKIYGGNKNGKTPNRKHNGVDNGKS
jgi:hypothetical protein